MRLHTLLFTIPHEKVGGYLQAVTTGIAAQPHFRFVRSTVAAKRVALALTLACASPLPGNSSAARIGLPDTIRLMRRGIAGDRYVMQSNAHTTFLLRFEKDGQNDDTNTDTTETRTEARRVRAVDADGALQVEERTEGGNNTVIKDGERNVVTIQPTGWLATYQPNGERVSRVKLPKPETPDKGDTNEPEPPRPTKPRPDDRLTTEPPFPDKALRVGDTWTGTILMLSTEISSDPEVTYTGKLVAIELHQNVPCARVEYTLSATSTKLPKVISRLLSEAATGVGTLKMTGTLTEYYTLDRGAVLDSEGKLSITMKFNLTEPNPNGDEDLHRGVQVTIKTSGKGTATKFPTYSPDLVPSATADK